MKKILLFLAMCLIGQVAWSQSALLADLLPMGVGTSIVRHLEPGKSVAYVSGISQNYFLITDEVAGTSRRARVDDLMVRDFEIMNGRVFFCGQKLSTRRGMVGFFSLEDLFWGGANISVFDYFVTYQAEVINFHDLALYQDELRKPKLALVGTDASGRYCVVELRAALNNNWHYTSAVGTNRHETMQHVVVTDNFVVTAGTYNNNQNGVSMRVYDRNNMLVLGGLQDQVHYYPSNGNTPQILYPLTSFAFTALDEDRVALLSHYDSSIPLSPTNADGYLLMSYDISQMLLNPSSDQQYLCMVPFQGSLHAQTIQGLGYDASANRLTGVINTNDSVGNQSLVLTATSALAPVGSWFYIPNIDFHAVDTRASYLVLSGHDAALTNRLVLLHQMQGNQSPCAIGIDRTFFPDRRFTEKTTEDILRISEHDIEFATYVPEALNVDQLTDQCQQ